MSVFFTYIFEASACLAAFYILYLLAFSKQKYFQLNRWYLLLGLLFSFIIPAIDIQTTVTNISQMYNAVLEPITINTEAVVAEQPMSFWFDLLLSLYLLGVIVASIRFLVQLSVVIRLVSSSDSRVKGNGYTLVNINGDGPIGSFFRYILWNNADQLSTKEEQMVISHEAVHAREWHTADVVLAEIAGIILWFNPFIYSFKKATQVNHEYIADHTVSQSETTEYIHLIATQALFANGISLTSSFNSSQIINRIKMLRTNTTRSTITRYLLVTPVFLMLIAVFSCKTMISPQVDPQPASIGEETFTIVEDQPSFPGGVTEFYSYVQANLKYPKKAKRKEVGGKVFIQFVVDKSGELRDTKVLKGIGYGCDEEALRVIANSPNWIPGKQRGKNVNVRMVLPITFLSK